MAQRISRAKQRIRDEGATFALPPTDERAERLRVVEQVLYLIFNEGYAATSGEALHRADLTDEAIRLTRLLHAGGARRPRGGRPARAHAADRRPAPGPHRSRRRARAAGRAGPHPLARRARRRGRRARHRRPAEGRDRSVPAPGGDRRGARRGGAGRGHRLAADPRPLPPARAGGPEPDGHAQPGRRRSPRWRARRPRSICSPPSRPTRAIAGHHRFHTVRAHLLERLGDTDAADRRRTAPRRRLSTSRPERRHLEARAARLAAD